MQIKVWSDFVCPFCYIGKRLLEQALEQFEHRDRVEVIFKSFQLDPGSKNDPSVSVHELIAHKYGMPLEKAKEMNAQLVLKAAKVGLTFDFDGVKQTNTRDAHRLAKLAQSMEKGLELTERLLKAHFTESRFIGDHGTLIQLAAEVGMDEGIVRRTLEGNDYLDEVEADQAQARQLRVTGVPFFVFDDKYAISGAQPLDVFVQTLEKCWGERQS